MPVLRHGSFKPAYSCINSIRNYFSSLEKPISDHELIVVGDRIMTDVVMANRMKRSKGEEGTGPLAIWTTGVWQKESMVMRWLERGLVNLVDRMAQRSNSKPMRSVSSEFIKS